MRGHPVINQIAFEGNDALDEEELTTEIQLRPRVVFTRTKVQQDVKRIIELYRRSGYFAAVVEPKVIQLAQNRVNLVYEIKEGPESGIRSISFVGNKVFSDSDLREGVRALRRGLRILRKQRLRGVVRRSTRSSRTDTSRLQPGSTTTV
mgnify:CR=1 FL=1